MAKLRSRGKKGEFVKGVSILVTKKLQSLADGIDVNVKKDIRNALEKKYKTNVAISYAEGYITGGKRSYHHTGKFMESIHAVIDENVVRIEIDADEYSNGKTTKDVYTFLTEGTSVKEPGYNPFISGTTKTENGRMSVYKSAERRPTPKHLFEEHTMNEMHGYLDNLANELESGKYTGKYLRKGK